MIEHLLSLRLSAGEVVLLASALFAIGAAIFRLLTERPEEPDLYQAPPRTVVEFPPQPTAFHRDVETDALFDTSLTGFMRHHPDGALLYYSARTKAAMDKGIPHQAFHYARMTASLAFGLHPELRETVFASSPLSTGIDLGERDGKRRVLRVVRSMNVEVIH